MPNEGERRDVVISPAPASATIVGHVPTVLISTPFWRYWLDVAIEQLEAAARARADGVRLRREGSGDFGNAIVEETKAGMQAAVASAACIESFWKTAASLSGYTPSINSPASKVALEVLTRSFDIEEAGLNCRLKALFDDRNLAIHSGETDDPTEPHPLGVGTGKGNSFFTAERAAEAVCLAAGLLVDCISSPRTGDEFLQMKQRFTAHLEHVRQRDEAARRIVVTQP